MLDGVPSWVLSYRLLAPMLTTIGCQPNSSGRCCHSCIKEGWNRTITEAKLSRISWDFSLINLASRPQTSCLFRLNESHTINNAKLESIAMNGLQK